MWLYSKNILYFFNKRFIVNSIIINKNIFSGLGQDYLKIFRTTNLDIESTRPDHFFEREDKITQFVTLLPIGRFPRV